ncbi:MAG TPA: hypothetical protein VNK43_12150 [Gemmatimonadales bacterium]|nr:hypothetical protein [Gemmatimonadales bacterium]
MTFRFGTPLAVFGWVLTGLGLFYVVAAGRAYLRGAGAPWPILLIGALAVVVGSSLVRWVRRTRRGK